MMIGLWLWNEIHKYSIYATYTHLHQLRPQPMLFLGTNDREANPATLSFCLNPVYSVVSFLAAKRLSNLRTNLFNTFGCKRIVNVYHVN